MKTLVLIPDLFPFGAITEAGFILPELKYLSEYFDRVIIAPRKKLSDNEDIKSFDLPDNVMISETMVTKPSIFRKIKGLRGNMKGVIRDLAYYKGKRCRDILAYSSYIGLNRENLKSLIEEYHLLSGQTLFYTFWFDFTTAAATLCTGCPVITRTHRTDLYEDQSFTSPYWRRETFKRLKGCYPVSTAGVEYLRSRYPEFKDIISLRKLGTVKPSERLNPDKKEPVDPYDLTLLSIARLSPEKGVDRQLKLLIEYALRHPDLSIRYIHIGDGLLKKEIEEIASSAPDNILIELRGAVSNSEVHALLATLHIDLLLLLSHSEGLPISLCEAISYGIPYLATDVGGISEIVPPTLLPLLPDDMTYTQFSDTMERILSSGPELRPKLFKYWQENFCADTLREEFAKEISGMFS